MKIKKIKINHYKSIKKPIILNGLNLNIFIGQNSCGKGNILDALEYILTNNNDLYDNKADLELDLEFSEEESIKYQLPNIKGSYKLKQGEKYLYFNNKKLTHTETLEKIFSPKIKRLDSLAFIDFQQTEKDFETLFNYPNKVEDFKKNLKNHFPKIHANENALDINYDHKGLYEGKKRVTIDRMGSGFRRIFIILLYIFHPQYEIILINEPENYLHPAMIKKLLWAMENSRSGQIFFTTHSPLFIKPVTLYQVTRVVKDRESTLAFSLNNKKYDYTRLIRELNADNLEMFFADKVVLVEGMSDRILLRGLLDKFYSGEKDIKVIPTQGKGNMKPYIDVLIMANIPYLIMLDKDIIKGNILKDLLNHLKIYLPKMNSRELIASLEEKDIFILDNGDLENNYPKKYQREDRKSLNALKAASLISKKEFNSKRMKNLKKIVNSL